MLLLAIPFTTLREARLDVSLPAVKQRAIRELRYGTKAKLMIGFDRRVWRAESEWQYLCRSPLCVTCACMIAVSFHPGILLASRPVLVVRAGTELRREVTVLWEWPSTHKDVRSAHRRQERL